MQCMIGWPNITAVFMHELMQVFNLCVCWEHGSQPSERDGERTRSLYQDLLSPPKHVWLAEA